MLALLPTFLTMQLVSPQANSIQTSPAAANLYASVQPIAAKPVPSFDDEQIKPLKTEQARLAALEAARIVEAQKALVIITQAVKTPQAAPVIASVGGALGAIAQCESHSNWATNTGNGYYGGLQFDIGTWGGYGGYARADLAPPDAQIAKASQIVATRGYSPWPACARSLGLL